MLRSHDIKLAFSVPKQISAGLSTSKERRMWANCAGCLEYEIVRPVCMSMAKNGILAELDMPYDSYCPSVKEDITKRKCNLCDAYFTSMAAAVTRHRRGEGCPSRRDIYSKVKRNS